MLVLVCSFKYLTIYYYAHHSLADFGFMINLFNMMPIGSMDGGRIAGALSPYAGVAGLGLGGFMAYEGYIHNPLFYLILLAGGYETFQRFYNPGSIPPNYYRISTTQRAVLTGGYFGLVGALIAAMAYNNQRRKSPELLQREKMLTERSWDERY
jgi:Zn-dependent protease